MSAHRRTRRHPQPALLLALVAMLLVLGLPAASSAGSVRTPAAVSSPTPSPSSATRSATPSPAPTPRASAEADDAAPVQVRLAALSPQVVRPTDELLVRATLRNTGDTTLDVPQATLRVNRFLLSTRSSVDEWVDRGLDDPSGSAVASVPLLGPLAPGQAVDVDLRVPAADLRLSPEAVAWGARGLAVEVTDGGARQGLLRTFVLWLPSAEPLTPTRLSVLVPLTGGPVDPLPTADPTSSAGDADASTPTTPDPAATSTEEAAGEGDEGDAATLPAFATVGAPTDEVLDRLEAVVEATADRADVSWALDPAMLTAARAAPAGSESRRWAEDLTPAANGREVLALPARDPDLAALAHGGGDELAAGAAVRAAAAADPALGSPTRAGLAWPADDAPDTATLDLAARSGATTVVVGDGALSTGELTYTPTGRATLDTDGGTVDALVSDTVLTAQLEAPSGTTPAAAAQRVLAETAVVTRERPNEQRHLLVAPARDWEPDVPVAEAQLTALASAPWVDLTPVSTLIATPDPGVERAALPGRRVADDELRPGQIGTMLRSRAELARFATIVPDPAALLAGADDAVLIPASVAWRADPVQRSAMVDGVVADLTARRSGVTVMSGSSLNLISETGRFPLGLRNDLPQPATVQVAVQPASSLLVIDRTETVTIPAESETQVRIPFHAVGSGDVDVVVALLAADGTPIGAPQEFTVRVRADWENVGTAVVAALLALAFVVGIVRTIRRGQTARRGAGTTPVSEIARLPEEQT